MHTMAIGPAFLFPTISYASSLKVTADRLGDEVARIGMALGVYFLVSAGIQVANGKPEGMQRLIMAIFGIMVMGLAPAIIRMVRTIV